MNLDKAYRIYVTDCLKMISRSTAGFLKGPYMQTRFYDIAFKRNPETRTGEEIAADIIKRAGLVVKKSGPI